MAVVATNSARPAPSPVRLTVFETAVTSALSGVLSSAVVFPLDTVKTRIQALSEAEDNTKHPPGKLASFMRRRLPLVYGILVSLRHGQVSVLYKGFNTNMVTTFFMQFCYFYWYTLLRANYVRKMHGATKGTRRVQLSTLSELGLGAVAGALAQLFILPLSIVATRQQVAHKPKSPSLTSSNGQESRAVSPPPETHNHSFSGVAKEVYHEKGMTGFWSGLKPSLILCSNPALTYGSFERIKSLVLNASGKDRLSPGQSFWIGAASKTLATVLTFPFILAKVRLQTRSGTTGEPRQITSLRAILHELAHGPDGLRGSYRGMEAHIHKTVLSQALLFVARDYFELGATALLEIKARRTQAAI